MIQISQLKLPVSHTEADLRQKIKKTLRCGEASFSYEIIRQSLDARHKEDKKFVYTVHVKAENEKKILKKVHNNNIMLTNERSYSFPKPGEQPLKTRPVIVGSGPAGLSAPGILPEQATVLWCWNGEKRQIKEWRL